MGVPVFRFVVCLHQERDRQLCRSKKVVACYEVSTLIEEPLFGNDPSYPLSSRPEC
jgi:hypothetical protein